MTVEDAAKLAAGNWHEFQCFCWYEQPDDADDWGIFYTSNRDSGLLDQSNAYVIGKALEPFAESDDPDVHFESHNHWAVGHVDGFSMRVLRDGQPTEAFKVYFDLQQRMADYPILDESDYSDRECKATDDNIESAVKYMRPKFILPDDWFSQLMEWFDCNNPNALESRDDQGGYPSDDDLTEAFDALGFAREE